MEEQAPEERPDEETLENQVEPTEEPKAPEVDSTRDEAGASSEAVTPSEAEAPQPAEEPLPTAEMPTLPTEAVEVNEPAPEAVVEEGEAVAEAPRPITPPTSGMRGGRLPINEVAPEASTEPAWYVVHCYSGYENKVRHNLEQRIETMGMKDRIFDVVIPTQEEIEVRDGKRRTVERHIFPGYVLVNMVLSEESWYVVRNTPGVTGFVGMGNLPTALRPEEVSQIIKRMEAEAPTVKVSFKEGERVRIIDGPFNDFRGTVSEIDMERTKVRVMVSFFGRETPVELDFLQVEKA